MECKGHKDSDHEEANVPTMAPGHAADQDQAMLNNPEQILLDIDVDDLIFSELPDFPCISSPSPSSAAGSTTLHAPAASSSSSSASSRTFLQFADGVGGGSQPDGTAAATSSSVVEHEQSITGGDEFPIDVGPLDIVLDEDDIDLFGLSIDVDDPSWDPSSLLRTDEAEPMHEVGLLPEQQEQGRCSNISEQEPARIFLDWLKNNRDAISPEHLRSIKLKRATIEGAAWWFGRTKQGRTQLLRLILTWVQNHHLHRNRPVLPNSDHREYAGTYGGASWIPGAASPPQALLATVGNGGVEMMCPSTLVAGPYGCRHCSAAPTSSVMVNSQSFSPATEFVDVAAAGPWPALPPQFASFPSMAPPQYSGGFMNNFHPMYHPGTGQRLGGAGVASATKEARKKRMARQRRFAHRNHHSNHVVGDSGSTRSSSVRNWTFWNSTPDAAAAHPVSDHETPVSENTQPPPAALLQPRSSDQYAPGDPKSQGLKCEKNLKFLLQKVLKQSDVGSLGRIVLPKKEAETLLPELDARNGISISMEDIGTSQVWNMRYRFWPNNKSRMYLLENTGDFVRSNGLQEGDFIVIYSDVKCCKYVRQEAEPRASSNRRCAKLRRQRRNGSEKMGGAGSIHEEADEKEEGDA
ncbi:regulatory protein viviparous-1-like isoform X2 [Zingiber officinale]|uniref:regulatory protein viviparous-1-like isoform X2 n=1 Tax=Zingiber officinale TaxID=94328 RepID=UPI001C4BCA99|nr:regulatory protein viviparous-1-like isoform X2 [Zingiber officinale]